MFWKPTVAIQGDVGSFMIKLAEGMKGYKCDQEWLDMLRGKDADKEKANRYCNQENDNAGLNWEFAYVQCDHIKHGAGV